jgi:hypothetical protein
MNIRQPRTISDQGRSEAPIEYLRKSLGRALTTSTQCSTWLCYCNEKNECAEATDYWRRYLAIDGQSEWATRARRSLKFCEMQQHLIA